MKSITYDHSFILAILYIPKLGSTGPSSSNILSSFMIHRILSRIDVRGMLRKKRNPEYQIQIVAVNVYYLVSWQSWVNLLLLLSSIFLALLIALAALSSFSCSARQRWKFSTTTPTNMLRTKNPTSRRNEMKYRSLHSL